ncbi:MAG: phosphate signaling complex protein PhoU [bacterium]
MRPGLEQAVEDLQEDMIHIGTLVENAIKNSVDSLVNRDLEMARKIIENDDEIDELERVIEVKCMTLIARQQPLAKDLRTIATALKMITDLERMADHACDIAKITLRLEGQPFIKPLVDIPEMARLTKQMVSDALDAYVREDIKLAEKVGQDDNNVDSLYKQIFDDLVKLMANDESKVNQSTYLLLIANYLERIGDHATNIAERVIYLVTGEMEDLNE